MNKQETNQNISDAVKEYVNKKNAAKQNMVNKLSKQDMVNIIFRQNDILAQQSSQMFDIVDMANAVEKNARIDEANKCSNIKQVGNTCAQINIARKQQLNLYENSVKIQIILFILLITVLVWFLYQCAKQSNKSFLTDIQ